MMRLRAFVGMMLAALALAVSPTPATAQVYPTGADLTDPAYYNVIPVAAPLIPQSRRSVDLTRFMPPPGNQGQLGSCVGWAVAYASRSFVAGIKGGAGWSLRGPSGQFSAGFLYNEVKARTAGFCDRKGIPIASALQFSASVGAVTLADFPYNAADCALRASSVLLSRADAYKIKDFASLGTSGGVPLDKVIESLDAGRPVILAIGVDNAFMYYRSGILSVYSGPSVGYHAIVAVGYDRDAGTLKLMNSWGPGWGEAGTVRISFEAAQRMIVEAYVILDASALDQIQPAPAPVPVPVPVPVPTPGPAPVPVPPPPPGPNPGPVPINHLQDRYYTWFDAVHDGDTAAVRKELELGLRPDVEVRHDTALYIAIEDGNLALVKLMLRYRPRLNSYVYRLGNYLVLASLAEHNNVAITQALIDGGIDPNILDSKGYSQLCTVSATDEIYPGSRQIYQILNAAGGRCIAPEVKFI